MQAEETDYERHVAVLVQNECNFLAESDPAFGVTGVVATLDTLDTLDTVRVRSKTHDRTFLPFARITSGIVQMHRGATTFQVGEEELSIDTVWQGGEQLTFGIRCFEQALVHVLGHTFGLDHPVDRDHHLRSWTHPRRNMMDAAFHGLDSDPSFQSRCFVDSGRLLLGDADALGMSRLLSEPEPSR